MNADASLLAESYVSWLRNSVSAEVLDGDVTELTTPFVDRHNDHLQVYAERQDGDVFVLTDDGYTISELKSSGVENRGRRRETLMSELVSGYGVIISGF